MFGGGEEHFAPPDEFDVDSLKRFGVLCGQLRHAEKPKQQLIEKMCADADAVGTSMAAKEIAAGAVIRHIKSWTGLKQLCGWYVLDKLAKDYPDTFRYLFGLQLLELGADHIPWEDPKLAPKYESLAEHWSCVFPGHIVDLIYKGRRERLWAAAHPDDVKKQKEEEEKTWAEEEKRHQDVDGLDEYAQPCLAYLQGNCSWGTGCTQLHPPGLENTLPPECRLGDWRCPACGSINRHFRRRCFSCPTEKPQYRKSDIDKQLQHKADATCCQFVPDDTRVFVGSLGYDPCDAAQAVRYWAARLATGDDLQAYLLERRTGLRSIFSYNRAQMPLAGSKRGRESEFDERELQRGDAAPPVVVSMPSLPPLPAVDRVFFIANRVLQRGAGDPHFAEHLFLLCRALDEAVRDPRFSQAATPDMCTAFVECVKLVYRSGCVAMANAAGSSRAAVPHPSVPFCADLKTKLPLLPLSPIQRDELRALCDSIVRGGT